LHVSAGAEFQPYGELTDVVTTFGEPQAEYSAIRKGAGLIDLPQRAILESTGRDRHAFLNNLLTNEIWNKETKQSLAPGTGRYAFFLNGKGRIVCDMNVLEHPAGDRTWLEMDGRLVASFCATLNKYLFAEQVKMSDMSTHLVEVALHGPGAFEALSSVSSAPPILPLPLSVATCDVAGVPVVVWRDDVCGVPGFHLVVPTESAVDLWTHVTKNLGEFNILTRKRLVRPVGWAAFNAARVEAGRPLFGIDFDDSVLPAETGALTFARAVSVTKGCYLGQEVVARMYSRKQFARQLVGLKVDDNALPIAGAILYDDVQNQVGGITSSTISPVLSNAAVALGYVKKQFVAPGSVVHVPAEGAMRKATVVPLPFLT